MSALSAAQSSSHKLLTAQFNRFGHIEIYDGGETEPAYYVQRDFDYPDVIELFGWRRPPAPRCEGEVGTQITMSTAWLDEHGPVTVRLDEEQVGQLAPFR